MLSHVDRQKNDSDPSAREHHSGKPGHEWILFQNTTFIDGSLVLATDFALH